MKQPFLQDEAFLEDVHSAPTSPHKATLWWLGQSGYLIKWNHRHLLIDPYLSDSLTQKYIHTEKPHIRMTSRVVAPEALNFIDIVTSSHNHTDHLDGETLIPLIHINPGITLITPEANRVFAAERIHMPHHFPVGIDAGQSLKIKDFTFYPIPAAHNELEQDEKGHYKFLGYVIQFGKWTLYHSGDTLWYEGLESWLKDFDLDIALLPINGNKPERKVAGNFGPHEAALLGRNLKAGRVIPCHYDMFTFNTANPEDFVREAEAVQQPYTVLLNGERFDLQ